MILFIVVYAACLTALTGGAQTGGAAGGAAAAGAGALRIKSVSVPELVELGGEGAPVLDCAYELTDVNGLVVKWFHEGGTEPVYQWIPPHAPQARGILLGHVDFNYTVSKSPYEMHRALRLLDVRAAMSGRYTCVVSTYSAEDRRSAVMQLYTRGKNLDLTYKRQGGGLVEVVCTVEDVFPQPTLNVTWGEGGENETAVAEVVRGADGLYDAVARAAPALRDATDLLCSLHVPHAQHDDTRALAYHSGVASTVARIPGALLSMALLRLLA